MKTRYDEARNIKMKVPNDPMPALKLFVPLWNIPFGIVYTDTIEHRLLHF